MSVAESYEQYPESVGLSLVGQEFPEEKSHIGREEAERLAVVGAFNARILACKIRLSALEELPLPSFGNQDEVLRQEIEQLRQQRDAMIFAHTLAAPVSSLPSFDVPVVMGADIAVPEETLSDKLARLNELALSYAALSMQIGASLHSVTQLPREAALGKLDTLFDISEVVVAANDGLTQIINESVDSLEHASDQLPAATVAEAEQTVVFDQAPEPPANPADREVAKTPVAPVNSAPIPTPRPEVAANQTAKFKMLPDYEQRIANIILQGDQPTKVIVHAITGSYHVERRHMDMVAEVIKDLESKGVIINLPAGMWTKGENTSNYMPSETEVPSLPSAAPQNGHLEQMLKHLRSVRQTPTKKPAQRGRYTQSSRRR